MNSGDLYSLFRSDVVDTARPYLWTDTEVYLYMNDAYRQFVRLTGGIPDTTSDDTAVAVTAGDAYSEISPRILRIRQAYIESTGHEITIVNQEDVGKLSRVDYGTSRVSIHDLTPGPIRYMVIGLQRNQNAGLVRWIQVPTTDDVVRLSIYRLPLAGVAEGDESFTFSEIGEEHIEWLLLWMKARAYGKQDAETFDRGKRDTFSQAFSEYCRTAKAEWERYKHKSRSVAYGGL